MQRARRLDDFAQHAVDPEADRRARFERLEVNVRRALAQCLEQDRVDRTDDRRRGCAARIGCRQQVFRWRKLLQQRRQIGLAREIGRDARRRSSGRPSPTSRAPTGCMRARAARQSDRRPPARRGSAAPGCAALRRVRRPTRWAACTRSPRRLRRRPGSTPCACANAYGICDGVRECGPGSRAAALAGPSVMRLISSERRVDRPANATAGPTPAASGTVVSGQYIRSSGAVFFCSPIT